MKELSLFNLSMSNIVR